MMPFGHDDPDAVHLWTMREAALGVIRLTRNASDDAVPADAELLEAVERGMSIIGRAARLVSPELQQAHPGVAWRQLAGVARLLADEDDSLEADELWRLVRGLPLLVRAIALLIPEEDDY